MKFSIIIPLYNQMEYVEEAIDSALAQTIPSEIIVVNDGSTDEGETVVRTKYPEVKLISQVNKGLASARNTALMHAHGDYVLPLDADDILQKNCVERMIEIAKKTKADIISPSIICFGLGETPVFLLEDPSIDDFKQGNRIPYCSAIKREALLECGGWSPRMDKGWEDLHLWYDLLTRGKKITTTHEPLVLYRTKRESMWTEARDKYSDILWDQIIKDFPHVESHRKQYES